MLDSVRVHQRSWAEAEAVERDVDRAYNTPTKAICSTLETQLRQQSKNNTNTYQRILHAQFTLRRLNGNVALRRNEEKQIGSKDTTMARAFFKARFPGIFRIHNPHARRSYINLLLWKARKPHRRRDVMRILNVSYYLQGHKRLPWVLSHAQFEELLGCFRHTDELYNAKRDLYTRVMGQQPRRPDAPAKLANRLCKVVTLSCIFKRFAELLGYHAFAAMIPVTQNENSRRRHLKFWHLTCRLLGIPFHIHSFHEATHPNYE